MNHIRFEHIFGYYGITRHETRSEHIVVQYQLSLSSTSVQRRYDLIWYTLAEFVIR